VGNRINSYISTSHTHNNGNRLEQDAPYDYVYDANGNMISKTDRNTLVTMTYTYDASNRLIGITTPISNIT